MKTFDELGLSEGTLLAIRKKGYEEPTPIQEKAIPLLLKSNVDIVGQAQTGTGKTAAFGLPIIENIVEKDARLKFVQAIIITPTRELAIQISEELNTLKGNKKISITPIYGGQAIELQLKRLRDGVDIVVGTPGRIIDHLNRRSLSLDNISYLVLDEGDEMLNMGFIEDIENILKRTNKNKRMLLFSATMPDEILKIAENYMKEYEFISIEDDQSIPPLTNQIYFEVSENDKFEALCRIRDIEKEFYGLIFCRTKVDVDKIASKLLDRGYNAFALHGDISQFQREKILKMFKEKKANMLVATDVAARGIDISNVTHVINYSLPQNPESYIHRIGRTGRAGKMGTAITFVTPDEYRRLIFIKKIVKTDIKKEKLPSIEDIIETKKTRIKDDINEIISSEDYDEYKNMANELLKNNEPDKIIAAMLKYSFKDEFDERKYTKIEDVIVNKGGKSRLFVALGNKDNMTPKTLVEFIKDKVKIDGSKIREVNVFENFSFITVPFEEAEIILKFFNRNRKGRRPIVSRAKESKKIT
jgi:ATP-dependent RNA helicase DeaD